MASEQLKHVKEFWASKRLAHFPLEIDTTKSPTILSRRSIFRAGATLAVAATVTPLFTPRVGPGRGRPSSRRRTPKRQRLLCFRIGDFQATVISDGYGPIPVSILAVNASEAELAQVLNTNFMQPVIQITTNMLVVDTGRSASLSIPALVRNSDQPSAAFPGSRRTCAGPVSRQKA